MTGYGIDAAVTGYGIGAKTGYVIGAGTGYGIAAVTGYGIASLDNSAAAVVSELILTPLPYKTETFDIGYNSAGHR